MTYRRCTAPARPRLPFAPKPKSPYTILDVVPLSSQANRDSESSPSPADDVAVLERYSRQILFPGIGPEGQARLARSRVGVVGCGATGAVSASLLARAGVGLLRLIDRDFVEPSNLQRQLLYDEADALGAMPKAVAARDRLLAANSAIEIEAHIADLAPTNIRDLLGDLDLILDATDNFETRYLLNDFAVRNELPWIYAAAVGSYAATMSILPKPANGGTVPWEPTACLTCVFPEPPTGPTETCDTAGILGPAVTLAASLQVGEALKLLTGHVDLLRRTLVSTDLWQPAAGHRLHRAEISARSPRPGCRTCDHRAFPHLEGRDRPQITLCGRNAVQIHEHHRPLDLRTLQATLARSPEITDVRSNSLLLRFRRGEQTITVFPDGRALIQGTTDPALARSLYARFLGT